VFDPEDYFYESWQPYPVAKYLFNGNGPSAVLEVFEASGE
jgi:hypothetical protein